MEITGTTALVTGGASGLGRAVAEQIVAAGGRVVIVDLPGSDGAAVAAQLAPDAAFAPADVTDEASIEAALDVAEELGDLRVVVNCAGIGPPRKIVGKDGPMPLEEFRRVVEINLVGTFNVIRLAAARIIARAPIGEERGVIVNTASVAAYDGQIGQAAYAGSKGGVVGLTLPIARELAQHRIRVTTIAPGLFRTPLFATLSDEVISSLSAQVPHPSRLGRPDEFASTVLHVVENPMLNGETIRLDGAIRLAAR